MKADAELDGKASMAPARAALMKVAKLRCDMKSSSIPVRPIRARRPPTLYIELSGSSCAYATLVAVDFEKVHADSEIFGMGADDTVELGARVVQNAGMTGKRHRHARTSGYPELAARAGALDSRLRGNDTMSEETRFE